MRTLYRIESVDQLAEIGWDDALRERALMLVEWSSRAEGERPIDRWEVDLQTRKAYPVSGRLRSRVSETRRGSLPFRWHCNELPGLVLGDRDLVTAGVRGAGV